jgi:short-subunit dehydrogenase
MDHCQWRLRPERPRTVLHRSEGLPLLNDGGALILGSIAGLKGFPVMSVYSATKAAIRSFARTWDQRAA